MEIQFNRTSFPYLKRAVEDVQNMEQTQEIKLTEGMPDIGRVLATWGQVILRSKEWRSDSILFSGGMMVWVMYLPEDGSEVRCVDSWIPFQIKWDLPDDLAEGKIRVNCLVRFVDARSVSPRKLMIRAGIAAMGEAFVPAEGYQYTAGETPEHLELLRLRYPIQIPREAGEVEFHLDEELTVAGDRAGKIVCYTIKPECTDKKVLGNKIAFRGNGNLHALLQYEDGSLESKEYILSFSQFAELQNTYGSDADTSVTLIPSNLELEWEENGQLRLKTSLVAQYLVSDRQILETMEDAYCPGSTLEIHQEELDVPVLLDTRRETIHGEMTAPGEMDRLLDISFLPDYPRYKWDDNNCYLSAPGTVQFLFYDDRGMIQSSVSKWEGSAAMKLGERTKISVHPLQMPEPQLSTSVSGAMIKGELPVEVRAEAESGPVTITGIEMAEAGEPDVGRPSLILRRAGGDRLWDIAKQSGSTMEAIREANHLDGDPTPGQMLLIPVS